jgi:hypothetical protein
MKKIKFLALAAFVMGIALSSCSKDQLEPPVDIQKTKVGTTNSDHTQEGGG